MTRKQKRAALKRKLGGGAKLAGLSVKQLEAKLGRKGKGKRPEKAKKASFRWSASNETRKKGLLGLVFKRTDGGWPPRGGKFDGRGSWGWTVMMDRAATRDRPRQDEPLDWDFAETKAKAKSAVEQFMRLH